MTTRRPALFLDRDGIVNEEVGYLHRAQDVRFVDGIVDLLAAANQLGYFTCVVTNQAGIARGLYTEDDFQSVTAYIHAELQKQGVRLDATYHSPFHPVHGTGRYKLDTDCRKPAPGMLLRAAADHNLNLPHSFMVGDRFSDMEAAAAAGVPYRFLFRCISSLPCAEGVTYTDITALRDVIGPLHAAAGA